MIASCMCNNDVYDVCANCMPHERQRASAATGFALQTAQLFQVDGTKPDLSVTSFSSSVREATIAFAATDASEVTYRWTDELFAFY